MEDDDREADDDTYPGAGEANQPRDYVPPAAGTGSLVTVVATATTMTTRTETIDETSTVTIAPPPQPTEPPEPPRKEPKPNVPDPRNTIRVCFPTGMWWSEPWAPAGENFCKDFEGQELDAMPAVDEERPYRV